MADLVKAYKHLDCFDGLPDQRAPRHTLWLEARPRPWHPRGDRVRGGEGAHSQDGQGGIRHSINATSRSARCFASSWQVCDSSENPATAFHGNCLCLKIFDSRPFLPFMPVTHRHYPIIEPVAGSALLAPLGCPVGGWSPFVGGWSTPPIPKVSMVPCGWVGGPTQRKKAPGWVGGLGCFLLGPPP